MMDMGQYMGVFVAECRELLESLNLSVVELERTPDATATIDEIFRVAHSFKGISSTMGFEQMAGLTHDMEHLLDIVRAGGRAVDQELVTALLGCLDLLEQAVDSIEHDGTEGIEPAALIAQLQALANDGAETTPVAVPAASAADVSLPSVESLPEGVELLHVGIDIAQHCDAVSIRAFMAWSAVEAAAELVWAHPSAEDLDDWELPRLDLLVMNDGAGLAEQLEEALARIPELTAVDVRPYGADAQRDAALPGVASVVVPIGEPEGELPAAEVAAATQSSTVRQRKSGTVRVDAERLDALMHLMGEVVVHRSAVETCLQDRDVDAALEAVQELRRSTQSLQAEVMRVRMVPVEAALMRMPRLVRDLSAKLGKQVELAITGADTEIDRSVVDALGEPLVHLVRNALDHGIEPPADREAAGKSPTGTLGIGARHEGGNVVISVEDDGRGVDYERVRARAVERGIVSAEEAALLDEAGVVELLFSAGFSTTEVATDVSGRGVGMDAVRAMCREWGGDVELESRLGHGSVARIRIPLTLAVMTVLVVRAGAHDVAIPIDRIERTIRLADHPRAETGAGNRIIRLDGDVIGELDLGATIGYGADEEPVFGVIVVGSGGRRVALSVRALVGEYEAVTKPLPPALGRERAFMGAAVQGDGSVVLIVDCDHLVDGGAATATGVGPTLAAATTGGEAVHG